MTIVENGVETITTGWTEDKPYSLTYSTETRMISGLFGAAVPFADVIHSETGMASHFLGTISKKMYDDISMGILHPGDMSFWMPNNTVAVRKIIVDFADGTFLDNTRKAIVGLNNKITLVPRVVDQDGVTWSDIKDIEVKNMQKLDFDMNINGAPASSYKATVPNGEKLVIQLNKTSRATIRVKAKVPGLDVIWLSLYPELYGYNEDELAKLAAWAATQQ